MKQLLQTAVSKSKYKRAKYFERSKVDNLDLIEPVVYSLLALASLTAWLYSSSRDCGAEELCSDERRSLSASTCLSCSASDGGGPANWPVHKVISSHSLMTYLVTLLVYWHRIVLDFYLLKIKMKRETIASN